MPYTKDSDIAIIGMALRLPNQVSSPEQFWAKLINKKDTFVRGENSGDLINTYSIIDRIDEYATKYFEIPEIEARFMDLQHRILLGLSQECIENSGIKVEPDNRVSVFTSASMSSYLMDILRNHQNIFQRSLDKVIDGNNPDSIATRISYKLGLNGQSMHIGSGCSSSLFAVVQGVQSLLSYQSDVSLIGGISIRLPDEKGYMYREGGINSKNGYCRPYSDDASGTIHGEGGATVLLKRLEDAIEDGDHIYSVISACASNNDSRKKTGFYAPSVEGQKEVILDAFDTFNIDADKIQYVEGQGTSTLVGDPIELVALSEVLNDKGVHNDNKIYIGSIKGNIGHTDSAAGIMGLVKAILTTYYGVIPPTVNLGKHNIKFDWEQSCLEFNTETIDWNVNKWYACVSSFGVCGTNVHVVLRRPFEMLEREKIEKNPKGDWQLILISAKNENALYNQLDDINCRIKSVNYNKRTICNYVRTYSSLEHFYYKGICMASSKYSDSETKSYVKLLGKKAVFVFSGQGNIPNICDLYETLLPFRYEVDKQLELIKEIDSNLANDVEKKMFGLDENLIDTLISQLAIYISELSYGRVLLNLGVKPSGVVGSSFGEIVGACLSSCFSDRDGIKLVYHRGKCMRDLAIEGLMIAVRINYELCKVYAKKYSVYIAAINSQSDLVLSGDKESMNFLIEDLKMTDIQYQVLSIRRPFHSPHMHEASKSFKDAIKNIEFKKPLFPLYSCVTGNLWDENSEYGAEYWSKHILETANFYKCIKSVLSISENFLLELGCPLISTRLFDNSDTSSVWLVRGSDKGKFSYFSYLSVLGALWACDSLKFNN